MSYTESLIENIRLSCKYILVLRIFKNSSRVRRYAFFRKIMFSNDEKFTMFSAHQFSELFSKNEIKKLNDVPTDFGDIRDIWVNETPSKLFDIMLPRFTYALCKLIKFSSSGWIPEDFNLYVIENAPPLEF